MPVGVGGVIDSKKTTSKRDVMLFANVVFRTEKSATREMRRVYTQFRFIKSFHKRASGVMLDVVIAIAMGRY